LAITPAQLERIEEFYAQRGAEAPLLMTGFNRRFAPAIGHVCEAVRGRSAPLIVNYRMNAGYLPATHWVHGAEGGGRNVGEACHIYDLFQALTGSSWIECRALSLRPRTGQFRSADNFVATARYADGSLCTLTYTALGAKEYPKERMDVFCDGMVLALDDYKSLSCTGRRGPRWNAPAANKGQFEELVVLGGALRGGGPWPIPLAEQLAVTRLSFAVDAALRVQADEG